MKFLVSQYGLQKVAQAFATLERSGDPSVVSKNVERFTEIFGVSVPELERAWIENVGAQNEPPVPAAKVAEIKTNTRR